MHQRADGDADPDAGNSISLAPGTLLGTAFQLLLKHDSAVLYFNKYKCSDPVI